MHPVVDQALCITCGNCQAVCPAEPNVFVIAETSNVVHPDACIACGACVDGCPVAAITLVEP